MESTSEASPVGPRWLVRAAEAMAYVAGAILCGVILISVASIAGRTFFGRPVLGDFELVERVTAVCVAWFLPYCQLVHGHVLVDFFTRSTGTRVRAALDLVANALLGAGIALISWRTLSGLVEIRETGEVSMILGVPTWIPIALMMPGLLGAVVCCAISVHSYWIEMRR